MQTRIKYFPTVPANCWGNPHDSVIPEHWGVERRDKPTGWFGISDHATLAAAHDAESALHFHNLGSDAAPSQWPS